MNSDRQQKLKQKPHPYLLPSWFFSQSGCESKMLLFHSVSPVANQNRVQSLLVLEILTDSRRTTFRPFPFRALNCVCRLTTVEVIRQNEGPSSSVRLQVAAVSCDECGAIPWDELQVSWFPVGGANSVFLRHLIALCLLV